MRPQGALRRIISYIWQPWIRWAYGASFDRHTEQYVPAAGLELLESRYVVDDLLKLLTARVPYPKTASCNIGFAPHKFELPLRQPAPKCPLCTQERPIAQLLLAGRVRPRTDLHGLAGGRLRRPGSGHSDMPVEPLI